MLNYTIGDRESYFIKRLLTNIYQRVGSNFESYPKLFEIEMQLYHCIGWEYMKCTQFFFKRNANLYADILSLVYKRDDGQISEKEDSSKFEHFFRLEQDIKFCPGEENGDINQLILKEWIKTFKERLESQCQTYLFSRKIGKLFSYSPTGKDKQYPHESIRAVIEEFGDNELINAFASSIIYGRDVYTRTNGKEEFNLAQKYKSMCERLQIRYPKTAKIFFIISERYMRESEYERKLAENEIF